MSEPAIRQRPGQRPPQDERELLTRAHALAGHTIGELGQRAGVVVPRDQRRAKGLVGSLLEWALGADAGSRAEPDFRALSVELKSLPLDARGRPRESTFVCSIALCEVAEQEWAASRVHHKLARVLWVPIEADPAIALPVRRVGHARLWSPSEREAALLQADWRELTELIGRGDVDQITGHLGRVLQVRPKAAHAGVRTRGRDSDGAPLATLPRGFYLRTAFTARLFASS